jgi:hypothetical protein
MKNKCFFAGILSILLIFGLLWAGCSQPADDNGGNNTGGSDTTVTFSSITANGSPTQTTTQLTLTFSQAITGLTAGDITLSGVSGVSKGNLSGSGPTYTLGISGFTSGGTLSVAVVKQGYTISGLQKTVTIYYYTSGGGGGTESITLNSNGQWGWQAVYESDSLFNGNKITQGDEYTLTYSFTSDVPMDYLQVVLIDNGAEGNGYRWVELSDYKKVKENITANTVVSGTVTITATGTATDTTAFANRLVLQAGTGTTSQPTLTFTALSLENNGSNPGGGDTAVTFSSVTANGSSTQTTTELTLTFSQAITGLSASDITLSGVSGVTKGTLSGSGSSYTLPISGFTSGGTLNVAVSKTGYTISGSPKTVTIYYYTSGGGGGDTAVTFSSLTANGSSSQTTTQLTLTFDQAITGLSANDITLSGVSVTKGTLSSSGTSYTLGISGVSAGGTLTVAVSKSGYTISNSSRTVTIYYYSAPQVPSTPTGVSATAQSSSSITISWNASSPTPAYYNIYRSTSSNGTYTSIGYVSGTSTSYSNTGLTASTTYYYKVDAENSAGGKSSQSSSASATTQAPTKLATPTGLEASTGALGNFVQISFNEVALAYSYELYRATSATGTYSQITASGGSTSGGKYILTDSSPQTGTRYYKVKAIPLSSMPNVIASDLSAYVSITK